ncbi:PREDICTED: cysteine-rich receptor-like protein kinase 10 isoform X2 [Camelina sativa]|uniref:Cysteine-rich receptor-like protein kinase 10 isoform X2 n=1 Tax=Camelina sativa TaxID=90675 RepID=A0ABM1QRD3_CAMSA|nr:PREDICTED: cysteine-rich receptor-like protein kinase 10 isoform X2 [Camelina sativa]
MSSSASFIFLFLISFLTSFREASAQDPTYIYHTCPNTTTFTRNSTYFANLRALLSSFTSRNASYSTGFQNATVGQAPERVTGLFNCRGDVSLEVCRSCVEFSVNETFTRCPNERDVTLYYDQCILRYSNRNILSTLNTDGGIILYNTQNVTSNQERFKDLLLSTLSQAATEAAGSSRKFDGRKANLTTFQTLYGFVQCTPDLTRQECLRCLQQTINGLPTDKIGGRLVVPSCSSRYELYPFYNESAITVPSPPPTPPPVSAPPRREYSICYLCAIV